MRYDRQKAIILGIATFAGVFAGAVVLMMINASFLRMPGGLPPTAATAALMKDAGAPAAPAGPDYKAITQRNLFRAKLQIELPRQKTAAEIEEETLAGIVRTMALKGVMLSGRKRDNYAIIDRGGPKGVWTYEIGEVIENGLALKEIRKDSVRLQKGDFDVVLRLFSSAAERLKGSGPALPAPKQVARVEPGKDDIRKEGSVTRISKSLAERLKADGNVIMSSIAIKPGADGVKVVAVDQGSIAQRMGIAPDDTLQEVNGRKLSSAGDMNQVYEALKNATNFEVKVLRNGRSETLRYEIR
jgi:type II secretory pathway component PulC